MVAFHNKILVAVDGSDQSMEAVRYAGSVFSPDSTDFVLYNVGNQLSGLFSDLDAYPHYKKRVTQVKKWATEQKKEICEFMDRASKALYDLGYSPDRVSTKTPSKSLGVTEDIVKESYLGYSAIVIGRTGLSRFKDWLLKSSAIKLVGKIKHIPIIVVGGSPETDKLLLAFDGTNGAMKGVACAGSMLATAETRMQLYSMITKSHKFWDVENNVHVLDNLDASDTEKDCDLVKKIKEAKKRLEKDGVDNSRITAKVLAVDQIQPAGIVQEALENGFGSIVVGRRGLISFIEEFFIGRVSKKVLDMAEQLAVWVI